MKTSGDSSYRYVAVGNAKTPIQVDELVDIVDVNHNKLANGTKVCVKCIDKLIEDYDHIGENKN